MARGRWTARRRRCRRICRRDQRWPRTTGRRRSAARRSPCRTARLAGFQPDIGDTAFSAPGRPQEIPRCVLSSRQAVLWHAHSPLGRGVGEGANAQGFEPSWGGLQSRFRTFSRGVVQMAALPALVDCTQGRKTADFTSLDLGCRLLQRSPEFPVAFFRQNFQ